MSWKILAIVVAALLLAQGNSVLYSALRMCDDDTCDIDMTYSSGYYNLTIQSAYLKANNKVTFCYRLRTAKNDTNGSCDLLGYGSSYSCMMFTSTTSPYTSNLSLFQADATLVPINNTNASGSSYNLTITYSTTSIALSTLTINSVYEMVVGNSQNLATNPNSKSVFFHTFRAANKTSYSKTGIFMQRYFQCFQTIFSSKYNYNLIFYGGVLRGGKDTMFFNFISYLSQDGTTVDTNATLNIWGGLDYSTSHAGRDMIGFSSGYGYTYDLNSLYASAPFNDTSNNINGTMDFVQGFTSNQESKISFFIAAGGYRLYDTQDANGDEVIRKKINYQFCYAVAYSTSTTVPIQPTDKIKHNFVDCWTPNIAVWQQMLALKSLLLLGLILFYVL